MAQTTGTALRATQPARVVVATTAPVTRLGIRAVLHEGFDMTVAGDATNHDELISACRRLQPDIAVIDAGPSGFDWQAAMRSLQDASPRTRVVILSPRESAHIRLDALAAGAAAIVHTDATAVEVRGALRDAMVPIPRQGIEPTRTRSPVPALVETPSPRELEVLSLVARGNTNREIGQTLGVTPHTVKKHLENLMTKLGVHDRTTAAVRALELGLIESTATPAQWAATSFRSGSR